MQSSSSSDDGDGDVEYSASSHPQQQQQPSYTPTTAIDVTSNTDAMQNQQLQPIVKTKKAGTKSRLLTAPALKRGSACSTCRKKKLKCDGLRPACTTCSRLKHDCLYGDPTNEKLFVQISDLSFKVLNLEAELAAYRANSVNPAGAALDQRRMRRRSPSFSQSRSPSPTFNHLNDNFHRQSMSTKDRDEGMTRFGDAARWIGSGRNPNDGDNGDEEGERKMQKNEQRSSSGEMDRYRARPRLRSPSPSAAVIPAVSSTTSSAVASAQMPQFVNATAGNLFPSFIIPHASTVPASQSPLSQQAHHQDRQSRNAAVHHHDQQQHHQQQQQAYPASSARSSSSFVVPPSAFDHTLRPDHLVQLNCSSSSSSSSASVIAASILSANHYQQQRSTLAPVSMVGMEPITQVQRPVASLQMLQAHLQSRAYIHQMEPYSNSRTPSSLLAMENDRLSNIAAGVGAGAGIGAGIGAGQGRAGAGDHSFHHYSSSQGSSSLGSSTDSSPVYSIISLPPLQSLSAQQQQPYMSHNKDNKNTSSSNGKSSTSPHLQPFPFCTSTLAGLSGLLHPMSREFLSTSPSSTSPSAASSTAAGPLTADRPSQQSSSSSSSSSSYLQQQNRSPFDAETQERNNRTSSEWSSASPQSQHQQQEYQKHSQNQKHPQNHPQQQHSQQHPQQQQSRQLIETHTFPDLTLLLEITTLYFSSIHMHLPFLSKPRFHHSLALPHTSIACSSTTALIYAVLASGAPFSDDAQIRALAPEFYERARVATEDGLRDLGGAVVTSTESVLGRRGHVTKVLTVEMVQALALLTMIEMGNGEQQRAFLTIAQAVRIGIMLGLHRMDENRIEQREARFGVRSAKRRLSPPALHPLPLDALGLEECRRTMCAVLVLDRLEAACVGWSTSLAEADLRLLLPTKDHLFELGTCSDKEEDNPLWWPTGGDLEEEDEDTLGGFAWLCRTVWLGGRIQSETYKAFGRSAAGPFCSNTYGSFLEDTTNLLDMDRQLDAVRHRLVRRSMACTSGVDSPTLLSLLVVNCLFLNLHHLRVASGRFTTLPFNPPSPSVHSLARSSPEYSLQRCLDALSAIADLLSHLSAHENLRTEIRRAVRIDSFTRFPPYIFFVLAFVAKFAIGDFKVLGTCWSRVECGKEQVQESAEKQADRERVVACGDAADAAIKKEGERAGAGLGVAATGDDVFGSARDEQRLDVIEICLSAMSRMAVVWQYMGVKFMGVINTDKQRLVKRVAGKARSPVTGLSLDPNFSSHQQSMRSTVPDLFAAPEPMLPSSIAASSTTATTTHGAMSIVMPMPIPSVDLFASGIETSMPMRSNLLQLQQDQLLHHQLHHHRPY